MALIDRKVNEWSQAVSSLDDKPKMTAADLKAAFDSNSNQLKPAINGIIDDLIAQDAASQIGAVTPTGETSNVQAELETLLNNMNDTFDKLKNLIVSDGSSDEILKEYLKKLDAEQIYTPKTDIYTKIQTLSENTKDLFGLTDEAIPDDVFVKVKSLLDAKIDIIFGTYEGNNSSSRNIDLGFYPLAVLVFDYRGAVFAHQSSLNYGGLALRNKDITDFNRQTTALKVVSNGFNVFYANTVPSPRTNQSNYTYYYMAFKVVE